MKVYAIYFLLPIFLTVYFELFGSIITNKFQINKFVFNGVVGFAVFFAIFQIIALPIVLLGLNFKFLLLLFVLEFLITFAFIYKNRNYYVINITYKETLIVISIIVLLISFLLPNTIGDVMSYDTVTYANLVSGNIYADRIGELGMSNGYDSTGGGYLLQGYYLFASCSYYLMSAICNVLKIDFFYFTQHTWMYSAMMYFFMSEGIANIFSKINGKYLSKILIIVFFVLFMGNFYWNSEQAYLGISYKMILVSYAGYYLYEYFENRNNRNLIMALIILIANVSCANSNSTLMIIFAFGIWLINNNTRASIRILGIATSLPLFTMMFQITNKNILFSMLTALTLIIIVLLFDKALLKLEQKKIKIIIGVGVAMLLIVLSFLVSDSFFSFNGFINNMSGYQDMTWDYTDFSTWWRSLANIIYIVIMLACIYYRNNKYVLCVSIIALIFFNPLAADIQNRYMIVFYRNYDIFINYFTLTLGICSIENMFKNRYIKNTCLLILIVAGILVAYNQFNYHPPGQKWEKEEKWSGYNNMLRMYNDEADILRFVKSYMSTKENKDIKVISSIYQIRAELPQFKTLYNRNNMFNEIENEKELYKIFYNEEYYGDPYAPKNPDYTNICNCLIENTYDLIIQKKDKLYYDKDVDSYYSITYLIDECGSYPIYENDSFAVYSFVN